MNKKILILAFIFLVAAFAIVPVVDHFIADEGSEIMPFVAADQACDLSNPQRPPDCPQG